MNENNFEKWSCFEIVSSFRIIIHWFLGGIVLVFLCAVGFAVIIGSTVCIVIAMIMFPYESDRIRGEAQAKAERYDKKYSKVSSNTYSYNSYSQRTVSGSEYQRSENSFDNDYELGSTYADNYDSNYNDSNSGYDNGYDNN